MKLRLLLPLLLALTPLAFADPHPGDGGGARNKDGSIVTGVLTAQFDPAEGILPFPSNLLYLGTTDLTLNVPVEDPTDISDPAVALSALDARVETLGRGGIWEYANAGARQRSYHRRCPVALPPL